MTRQYIGARYVPLMCGDYDSTRSYEALSIVTYGNNSYTSKKPVPVGVNPTNTEYWVLTSNYSGQIAELISQIASVSETVGEHTEDISSLDNRVTTLEGDVESLNTSVNTLQGNVSDLIPRTTALETDVANMQNDIAVLIGDSYGYGYAPGVTYGWCDLVPQYLSNVYTCKTLAYGGAGFTNVGHDRTFNLMITEIAGTMTDNERTSTKKVLVAGGWNDMNSGQNLDTVKADVKTFVANAKTLFPNADIIICGMGWCRSGTKRHNLYSNYFRVIRDGACESGASFTLDAVKPLHWYTYISNDDVHPTQDGEYAISRAIASIIVNGSYANFYKGEDYTGTNVSTNLKTTSPAPRIFVGMDDMDVYVNLKDVGLEFNDTNVYTNQWVEVATFECPLLVGYADWASEFTAFVACANFYDNDSGSFITAPVQVGFVRDGEYGVKMLISIRVADSASGYTPIKLGRLNLYATTAHMIFDLC